MKLLAVSVGQPREVSYRDRRGRERTVATGIFKSPVPGRVRLRALGLAAGVIGGAEIVGEGAVGVFVDRFGKRFVVAAGLLCTLMYAVIPSTSASLTRGRDTY